MAHGDELVGALGGHDASDLSHGEDVALGDAARLDEGEGLRFHADAALGDGLADGVVLGRYVHHAGAP